MASSETVFQTYPLDQIYFYLTKGCNLRCRHCWVEPKYQTEDRTYPALDLKTFRSIINQAKPLGLTRVKLTGGEPLLHPQFFEILEIIRTEDLILNVETNGILCSQLFAEAIAACKNPFVSVSLDGANAETHEWVRGVEGCFEAALEGARNLTKAGLTTQLIMSVMKRNKDHLKDMVRIAESIDAESVKFNIVQPAARGKNLFERGEILTIEELVRLGEWVEKELTPSTNLRVIFSHPHAFQPLSTLFGSNGDGCSTCGILSIIGVLADGSYALCGIGETVSELVFGHAAKERLSDIWSDAKVLTELRQGLPRMFGGICGDCIMRDICLGNCVAQNYYMSKSLWAPFWYCEQANQAGLFPSSRKKSAQNQSRLL
ncbi:SynChlorMet cassette radical SAM/SPASM protein ScmF [Acidobacteriota bacterium]